MPPAILAATLARSSSAGSRIPPTVLKPGCTSWPPARSHARSSHILPRARQAIRAPSRVRKQLPPNKAKSRKYRRRPMLNRRNLLLASIAAGVALPNRTAFAKAAQPMTPVNFEVPPGAGDCHTNIHGDPEKFPCFSGRVYTPEPASPEEMAALHKALHIERVVIVTPSVYGSDNSATRFGMMARGATARGVAVIDDKTSEADLDAMNKAGFRGIRLNLATGGVSDPNVGRPRFLAAVERVKARGWHIQLYTGLPMIAPPQDSFP